MFATHEENYNQNKKYYVLLLQLKQKMYVPVIVGYVCCTLGS